MRIAVIFGFCLMVTSFFAQNTPSTITSIKVYALPLHLKTALALDVDAIRSFDDEFLKITTIKDSTIIRNFEALKLPYHPVQDTNVDYRNPRIVIDVVYSGQIKTYVLDMYLSYYFERNWYGIDIEFKKWLAKNECLNQ